MIRGDGGREGKRGHKYYLEDENMDMQLQLLSHPQDVVVVGYMYSMEALS